MKTFDERGKPVLRFRPDGSFRVLMISDFHGKPDYNPKLTWAIETMVDYAKPDIVMLGGDQLCGITPEILRSYLSDVTEPMNRRGIPWAHVFGNHDGEQPMTKEEQEPVYESFPLCLSDAGPEEISGVGNYCLPVYGRDSDEVSYHLYALDSHTNVHDFTRKFGLPDDTVFVLRDHFSDGHDQAAPMFDQVMWYYNHSRNAERAAGRKLPALMFLHVPVVEFCLLYRNPEEVGFVGHKREDVACSELNSGLFFACLERGDVKGIFAGHEHLCDFQGQYCGVTLAYDCCLGYDMSTTTTCGAGESSTSRRTAASPPVRCACGIWQGRNACGTRTSSRAGTSTLFATCTRKGEDTMELDLKKETADRLRLTLNRDGEFRVLFVSDFHAPSDRDWDERLPRAIGALLDHTKADLCVNLGDFISDGEMDSEDRFRRYAAAIAEPCETRGVPWCHVPGNHDHEEGIPTEVFAAHPHCLSLRGPDSLPGYGTYTVPVYESPASDVPAFMIWLFDSHRGTSQWAEEYGIPAPYDFAAATWGFDAGGGIYHAQARWYWERDVALEKKYGHKIPGIMGMHIPLQEHSLIPRNPSLTFMTGELEESAGVPAFNPGLFAAAYERGDISAIVSGHDHINSFAGKYMGIELSEDASLGYDVYGTDRLRGGRLITLKASDPMKPDSVHAYLKDCPGAADFIFREGHDNA